MTDEVFEDIRGTATPTASPPGSPEELLAFPDTRERLAMDGLDPAFYRLLFAARKAQPFHIVFETFDADDAARAAGLAINVRPAAANGGDHGPLHAAILAAAVTEGVTLQNPSAGRYEVAS